MSFIYTDYQYIFLTNPVLPAMLLSSDIEITIDKPVIGCCMLMFIVKRVNRLCIVSRWLFSTKPTWWGHSCINFLLSMYVLLLRAKLFLAIIA